jgi:hypothetical protein
MNTSCQIKTDNSQLILVEQRGPNQDLDCLNIRLASSKFAAKGAVDLKKQKQSDPLPRVSAGLQVEGTGRCRANMAQPRQARPDYGLSFQVKVLQTS